jgi:hypothetical protein
MISKIYILYCIIGIVSSFFDIETEGVSVSNEDIPYWILNLTIIFCLLKEKKYAWYILMFILTTTIPIVYNYGTNMAYERIFFTMSPLFNVPIKKPIMAFFWLRNIGFTLQLLLIIWLLFKETRVTYGVTAPAR